MSANPDFLRAIQENPDDDAPRLIYADWLEERGDDERAEVIRLGCELARLREGDPRWPWIEKHLPELHPGDHDCLFNDGTRRAQLAERQRELLKANDRKWRERLPKLRGLHWGRFERGFISTIRVTYPLDFAANAEALFAASPITEAHFEGLSINRLSKLIASPHLSRLRGIRLSTAVAADAYLVGAVAGCEHLANLTKLDLNDNDIGPEGCRVLAGTPHLANLTTLHLKWCMLGTEGAIALLQSPYLKRLRALHVGFELDFSLTRIAALPELAKVAELEMTRNEMGPRQVAEFGQSPYVKKLTHLGLSNNALGVEGGGILAGAAFLEQLVSLDVDYNNLGDQGVRMLLASPRTAALQVLRLAANKIGDEGATILASAPHLAGLRLLDLGGNRIGRLGVHALAQSPHLANLTVIDLVGSGVGDDGAKALSKSPTLAKLNVLVLAFNNISDAGGLALAESPYLQHLNALHMEGNPLTRKAKTALRERFGNAVSISGPVGVTGESLAGCVIVTPTRRRAGGALRQRTA
jgi:uncharacterized protein (TIGR02996 family)